MNDQLLAGTLATWKDLEAELASIEWLWQSWLPKGVVTMLAADPGVGKSMLALSVCKVILDGGLWFEGVHEHQGNADNFVLWVECESGEPFHILRSKKLGVDTDRVYTMRAIGEDASTPALTSHKDKERLMAIMALPNVPLVVVDSLSGAISGIDENTAEVGKVVQWLSEQAKRFGKSVLLIHHMNKSAMRTRNGESLPSMADVRGSTAVLQHCRVVWALDTPYGDDAKPRLSCIKNNLAPKPHSIPLLIHPDGYIVKSGEIQTGNLGIRSTQYRDDFSP